ncbi:MAG: peptidoglycan DD-metalloendopeptidase family protein [Chloroflexota bacterium]
MNTHTPVPAAGGRRWPVVFTVLVVIFLATILALLNTHASAAVAADPTPVAAGGGEYTVPHVEHLTEADRADIEATIAANVSHLMETGQISTPRMSETVALAWPLMAAPDFDDPGYYTITGYVDHNPAFPGQLLDYACGQRTYDTSGGYNHQGTDYYLWPFAWNKMAEGDVMVVAAAPGVIVNKTDGNFDQSCSFNSQKWNAIYIRHADGSIAWYGHLKRDSVTTKQIGETVAVGEYLGLVGSSGNSTGPHLHLELYDSSYHLIDPYAGSCNPTTPVSWWQAQRPYQDPAVNKLMTGSAPVSFQSCPSQDITNEATVFQPGDIIYFTAFYRDQPGGDVSTYRLLRPDGTVHVEWTHSSPQSFYKMSYWWWAFELGPDLPSGTWTFEVEFEGTTTSHAFYLGQAASGTPPPTSLLSWPHRLLSVGHINSCWWGYAGRWSNAHGNAIPGTDSTLDSGN